MLATTTIQAQRSAAASLAMPVAPRVALAIAVLLALSAAVLFERRLAQALSQPLPLGMLIGVALVAAAAAMASGLLVRRSASSPARTAARWLVTGSLPLLAIGLSLPQSPVAGLVVLWLSVVVAEIQLWRRAGRDAPQLLRTSERKAAHPPATGVHSPSDRTVAASPDTNATQQLIYRCAADHTLVVEGWLRIGFALGERTVNAHVAFCPAFLSSPQVDVELVAGPDCTIRQALVVPWGVRWELKLAAPAAEATSVTFEFLARERELHAAAAATQNVP